MIEPGKFRIIIEQRGDGDAWQGVFFSDLRPRDYGYLALLLSGVDLAAFNAAPAEEQTRVIHKLATLQPAPASVQ